MKKIIVYLFMIISFISYSNNKCVDNTCKVTETVEKNVNKKRDFEKIDRDKIFKKDNFIVYSALWCGHCRAEYRHLQEIYDKYKDNFNIIVFVSNDNSKEEILSYMEKNNYTFPIYYDENREFFNIYQITYYPTILKHEDKHHVIRMENFTFNLQNFYEKNREIIDRNVREKLSDLVVMDKNSKIIKLLDVIGDNSIVMYGAPWCSDCVRVSKRLNKNKGKKEFIYLVDPKKMTYNDYLEFTNTTEYKNVYYVTTNAIRNRFNINWIPSVFEVERGIITNSFTKVK